MLKQIALIATLALAGSAFAADSACEATAKEKKLAGAAKTSFLKKCEADAGTAAQSGAKDKCEASAKEKKLAGAAKTSHIKKCMTDAQAPAAAPAAPASAPAKK